MSTPLDAMYGAAVRSPITGIDALFRGLDHMSAETKKIVVVPTLRAAAKVVQTIAMRNAPVGPSIYRRTKSAFASSSHSKAHSSGSLRRSIKIMVRSYTNKPFMPVEAYVYTKRGYYEDKNAAFYSHMVEFGHRAGRGRVAGRKFMTRSADEAVGPAYQAAVMAATKAFKKLSLDAWREARAA